MRARTLVTNRPPGSGALDSPEGLQATRRPKGVNAEAHPIPPPEAAASGPESAVARFLRSFQVLLRSMRLYHKNHPRVLESLDAAERNLRAALRWLPSIGVAVERNTLLVPMLGERSLALQHSELKTLAEELFRCGIFALVFLPETNLGELDALARLLNGTLFGEGESAHRGTAAPAHRHQDWSTRLAKHELSGIRVNARLQRKVDTVVASLIAVLLAYGSPPQGTDSEPSRAAPGTEQTDGRSTAAGFEELARALRLLAKLAPSADPAQPSSPQETARAFHAVLTEADRQTVGRLVAATTRQAPHEGETCDAYVVRVADALVLEFASEEFGAGRVRPPELRGLFDRLSRELAGHFAASASQQVSPVVAQWADEAHGEKLSERFWAALPAEEVIRVLQGPDAWCVPVASLRRTLEQQLAAGRPMPSRQSDASGEVSSSEARQLLFDYVRCLESKEAAARHAVATGLAELHPLLERLWPHQLPAELTRGVVSALERETSPGIAGLLTAVTQNFARLAISQGDYAGFERILETLERAPRDADHAHLTTLAARFIADERWLLLVDASLANRPLDPVLPRLLRRDPERLLDRLGLLLTTPNGLESLPAMTRLLRAIGEPAMGALEKRLAERRRQRVATAVKLLAATEAERLVAALPRRLRSWDWSLQDLAVSELARQSDPRTPGVARAFLEALPEAHAMVVPIMLDHIGLARETSAVPLLLEIAAGEHEHLRDIFIRIKAVEALGRMCVPEAAELLRTILRQRNGLTHTEPAGLRAAAEEALALLENRPSSARLRAAQEALEKASLSFTRPRRYLRIPLSSPFEAQIEGPHSATVRVRTISLGGAFLESQRRLAVGDSLRLEIRAGLRHIHSTAVVRNITLSGGGVEFVHMPHEDREKLRKLVRRLQRS